MKRTSIGISAAAIVTGLAILATNVLADEARAGHSIWSGVYTTAQAERGATTYAASCSLCHGAEMRGGPGVPGIVGPEFMFNWTGKTAAELFAYVKAMMPPGQAGSLSDQQYLDLVAEILRGNDFPAGTAAELPKDPQQLAQITIAREKS